MARATSLLLLGLALLICALGASASDLDPAEEAFNSESGKNRALTITTQDASKVEFRSTTNDNDFKFTADLSSDAPRMVVDWESGGNEDIDYGVEVRFVKLIEFTDSGNDGYKPGTNDVIEKTYDYTSSKGWGAYSTPTKGADGVYTFSIAHAASGSEVVFKFAEKDFTMQGNTVPATGVKFDFKLNNFQYTKAGTDLALQARVKFSNDCDLEEYSGSDDALVVGNNVTTAQVFFQWANTLDSPVGAGVSSYKAGAGVSGVNEDDVFFTFDVDAAHAITNIVWDPIYGVSSGAASVAASVFAVVIALALML